MTCLRSSLGRPGHFKSIHAEFEFLVWIFERSTFVRAPAAARERRATADGGGDRAGAAGQERVALGGLHVVPSIRFLIVIQINWHSRLLLGSLT